MTVAESRSGILAFFAPVCATSSDIQRPAPHRRFAQHKRPRGHDDGGADIGLGPAEGGDDGAPDYLLSLRRRVMRRLADATNRENAKVPDNMSAAPHDSAAPSAIVAQPFAAANCALCDAPSRFCVCDRMDEPPSALPVAFASQGPAATDAAVRGGAHDGDGHCSESEEENHVRRQMLRVLLRLEKQGVWLTSDGNKRGVGSICGTSYCRSTRKFSVENVLLTKAMASAGKVWGDESGDNRRVFRTTSRQSQLDSYQWKNLLEAALTQSSAGSRGPRKDSRRRIDFPTNGELIMGFALAGLQPSFGQSAREVNAKFKAKLV